MSVIGHNLLHPIIHELQLLSPDGILHTLDQEMARLFHLDMGESQKQAHRIQESLDLSILIIHHGNRNATFAGARRPLWLFRDNELIEIHGTKFSVDGDQADQKSFSCIRSSSRRAIAVICSLMDFRTSWARRAASLAPNNCANYSQKFIFCR
jgi:hypothetical protein